MVRATLIGTILVLALIVPGQALGYARPVIPAEALTGNADVLVHYPSADADGAAGAAQALSIVSDIRSRFVAATGMPLPKPDALPALDARFDVYLMADDTNQTASDNYGSPSVDGDSAFIAIGHGFWTGDRARATASIAHEFVHASQLGIDQGEYGPEAWWAEATANWGAYRTEGLSFTGTGADDFLRNGNGDLGVLDAGPMICNLPTYCGWAPWVLWLGDVYGQDVVAAIWQRQKLLGAGVYGSHVRAAIDAELAARGTTLPRAFLDWTAIAPFMRYAPLDVAEPDPLKFRPCLDRTATQSFDVVDWGYRDLAYRVAGCPGLTGATRADVTVTGTGAADARVTSWDGSSATAAVAPEAASPTSATFSVPLVPAPVGFAVVIPDAGTGSPRHADISVSVALPTKGLPPLGDRTAPSSAIFQIGCPLHARGLRLCRIRGFAADRTAPVSGLKGVEISVSRSVGHRRCLAVHSNGRIVGGLCSKVPWLSTRLLTRPADSWSRSVRLSRGRWTVSSRAFDRAGNVQRKPAHLSKSLSR